MKSPVTWVLVADGAHARLYEKSSPKSGLVARPDAALEQTLPPTRDLGTDKPGRSYDSAGKGRHAMQPKADWHDQAKADFARTIGDYLEAQLHRQSYGRLILAAPPRFLGQLRDILNARVAETVTAEINKDLIALPVPDLEDYLARHANL